MEIDVSLVSRLVAAQFPQWKDLSIQRVEPNGWDNRTFRLGTEMSVRLPSAACYTAQVDKEHRWLPILAPLLPLAVPIPLARGLAAEEYPWNWSIYRWLDGETATAERINDLHEFATTLAQFLLAFWQIDAADGPSPGRHNFFRGGPLSVYDRETQDAIASLSGLIDVDATTQVWASGLKSSWHGAPVWLHGDVHPTNLLVRDGCLSAVIDFGCIGVGDPACDLTIAWTLFSGDIREAFRAAIAIDGPTWARSRAWALWKALITLAAAIDTNPLVAATARQIIDDVVADHQLGA